MGVDHAGGAVETGVRDTPHADPAVGVGHVLEQILDGVVGVRRLVDVGWFRLVIQVRADVYERAFREIQVANILVDEDVALIPEELAWADGLGVLVVIRRVCGS